MTLREQVTAWAEQAPNGVVLLLTQRHLIPLIQQAFSDVTYVDPHGYANTLSLLQHKAIVAGKKTIAYMPTTVRAHRAAFLPTVAASLYRNDARALIVKMVRAPHRMVLTSPVGKEIVLQE